MARFYEQVMEFKKTQDEIAECEEFLREHGRSTSGERLPSVREQAIKLRDSTPKYFGDHYVTAITTYGDLKDRVEETFQEKGFGLQFDKQRRNTYNRELDLMAQVAPSASHDSLKAYPFWKPSRFSVVSTMFGAVCGCMAYLTGQAIRYVVTQDSNIQLENLTSADNLPYLTGSIGAGLLAKLFLDYKLRKAARQDVRQEVSDLVDALNETPQVVGEQ